MCSSSRFVSLSRQPDKCDRYPASCPFHLSFEEGRSPQNHSTLCPRLLAFDQKSTRLHLIRPGECEGESYSSYELIFYRRGRVVSQLGQLEGIVSLPFPATEAPFTYLYCNFSTELSNKFLRGET
ncbi:uncharacterized protein BJ212DRAFT_2555 [Suillus subaureus]|uniref:Uncharacterized protein n=1 Tax=Suillus subaureus TaxID=48587 RepID=A0A9P7EP13_9AGAM|nr:uncharacterized protein BJ212DRAFT_2555 [Suillus subaureus]KAG1826741.1 hypothetical protein BJ212DRAFT_2555 [Suillus subaureus]